MEIKSITIQFQGIGKDTTTHEKVCPVVVQNEYGIIVELDKPTRQNQVPYLFLKNSQIRKRKFTVEARQGETIEKIEALIIDIEYEPATTEPATTEPATTEPATTEPAKNKNRKAGK